LNPTDKKGAPERKLRIWPVKSSCQAVTQRSTNRVIHNWLVLCYW